MDWNTFDEAATAEKTPIRERPPGRPQWRHATRRRLFLAVFAFALALVLGLLYEVWSLHRVERTLHHMKLHEDQMRLALELEHAVRSQYAHQAHFVVGEHAHLAGQREARSRALQLTRTLARSLDEPDALKLLEAIESGSNELDQIFMREIAPAVLEGSQDAMLLHDKSYALVAAIENNTDLLFQRLQNATFALRHEVQLLEEATLRWAIVLLVAAPLFAAGVALYFGRSVARPLAQLGEGAARVASGDLEARIPIDTPDEFGILAAEFNAMTAALKENNRKLVESEKLAGIGRLAAGFAHEINNPLTVVLGYLMRHRRSATGAMAKDLEVAEQEVLRCKDIVQELLEIARPSVAVASARVDLRELCDEVVATLRGSGVLDGASAIVEGTGTAVGSRDKVRQVVVNLVKNAAEASGSTGHVAIRIEDASPWVEVSVADDGPGVDATARARLFEPFFTTKSHGTGLGLAVSRSIVRAHGGDIEVPEVAAGAVFKVRLRQELPGGKAG